MSMSNRADDLDRALAEMGQAEAAAYDDAMSRMTLLRELVELRNRRGLSQKAVAELMDTVQSAVSELENGRSEPRLSTLQRYVRAIGSELRIHLADESPSLEDIALDSAPVTAEGNLGRVLRALLREDYEHGSQPGQLVQDTGLSEAVVDKAVDRLSSKGWVRKVGSTEHRVPIVTSNPDRALVVGVSIRQDHVQGVITNLRAETPLAIRRRTLSGTDPHTAVAAVADLVSDLVESGSDGKEVIGLGVELAGVVREPLGMVCFAPEFEPHNKLWHAYSLEAELQDATGLRTVVENDCNALAVHEYLRRGDTSDLAVVLMARNGGIGAGIVHDGKVLHGKFGISGEIGHVVVDEHGVPCKHPGQRGCLETVAGVSAIARRVAEAEAHGESRSAVYRSAGERVGDVLVTFTSILAPELIVMYGPEELTGEHEHASARAFSGGVRSRLSQGWFVHAGMKPNVEPRVLDATAGARGAASVAVSHFLNHPRQWLSALGAESGTVSYAVSAAEPM